MLPPTWPLDELGNENLALNPDARASASSCLEGYAIHRILHLNDGRFGNPSSWIAQSEPAWVEIDLSADCWIAGLQA